MFDFFKKDDHKFVICIKNRESDHRRFIASIDAKTNAIELTWSRERAKKYNDVNKATHDLKIVRDAYAKRGCTITLD